MILHPPRRKTGQKDANFLPSYLAVKLHGGQGHLPRLQTRRERRPLIPALIRVPGSPFSGAGRRFGSG
jgi:hypothetical protein